MTASLDVITKRIYQVLAYGSFAVIVAVLGYAAFSIITQDPSVVGATLVNVEFPPPSISPIYMKPITYLYFASLVFMYTALELNKERIRKLPDSAISLVKLAAFVLAATFFFELAYNLVFWGGQIAYQSIIGHLNPDAVINSFPNPKTPWNVVFASKLWTVFLITGTYVFYYMTRVESYRTNQALRQAVASKPPQA